MKLIQVDQETHQALKVLAVTKGVSLKDLVQNLLAKALKGARK
jgi:predicted HicB family RNase H-like nuclease